LASCADAARLLTEGGVLLLATDTLPGLHARVDRPAAVRRVAAIKGRPGDKPLLVLAASATAAATVTAALTPRQAAYADRCWPGPFSLILPAAPGLAPEVTGGGATVAVRVPRHPGLVGLLDAAGAPLVSTSANRAGDEPARSLAEAERRLGDQVDGVFDPGESGDPEARASALVDLVRWPPRLLREGPLPAPPVAGDDLDPAGGET
jgi:L-threonylcarbamoyladenylate synthase